MTSRRCIVCTFVEAAHPEVGGGYQPHPFEPADHITVPGYDGPERRHGIRRMNDRVRTVEQAVAAVYGAKPAST